MRICGPIALLPVLLALFCIGQTAASQTLISADQNRLAGTVQQSERHMDAVTVSSDKPDRFDWLLASDAGAPDHPQRIVSRKAPENMAWKDLSPWKWFFNAGYRHDELDWSFALPNINIRSELQWRDLESIQFEFGLQRRLWRSFRLKGTLAYASVFNGDNQDSDYNSNNRMDEFSRSNNSTDDGDLWDLSLGLSYDVNLFSDRLVLSPVVGYSFHDQNLQITQGVQTIPPSGPFNGLDSSYDPTWYGPWIGAEFLYNSYGKSLPMPGHEIFFGIEYHFADFEARANWNLREDLAQPVSFKQDADGTGWVLTGGVNYLFNPRWSVNLAGKYQKWETESGGRHRFFFSDGTVFEAKLNEVTWDTYSISAGITCRF